MFSYPQAVVVTDGQLAALSGVQKTALALVLTPREDRLVDFRGENWSVFLGSQHFPHRFPSDAEPCRVCPGSLMAIHMLSIVY